MELVEMITGTIEEASTMNQKQRFDKLSGR